MAQWQWASPIVFASKKHRFLWFFIDFHKLNAVTFKNADLIALMDGCIDSPCKAIIFLNLNPSSGYWHIEIDERNQNKTTLTRHNGLLRFVHMLFSLKNAPKCAPAREGSDSMESQVAVRSLLSWEYRNIVIVAFRSLFHLLSVLGQFSDVSVSLNLEKWYFFDDKIKNRCPVMKAGKTRHFGRGNWRLLRTEAADKRERVEVSPQPVFRLLPAPI